MQGAVLAFFAFIGFEDMINVAEETRDPERTIPLGLILAMAGAAVLYIAVAVTAVSVVPWQELAAAPGPITEVMGRAAPSIPPIVFTAITLFAVANTALVNYVTASRLIYGMARQGLLPRTLGNVHAARRTPHIAVAALFLVLAPLALLGTITELAAATVLLLLLVFMVVNGALVILKRRKSEALGRFEVPLFVPVLGALVCLVLIVVRVATGDMEAPLLAGAPSARLARDLCRDAENALGARLGEPMRRMALIASPVQAAHIGDRGFRPLGLDFQRRDQGVLGLDHEPVALAFNADSHGELRLHADAPLPSMPSRRQKPSKGRKPSHMNKADEPAIAPVTGAGPNPGGASRSRRCSASVPASASARRGGLDIVGHRLGLGLLAEDRRGDRRVELIDVGEGGDLAMFVGHGGEIGGVNAHAAGRC